MELCTAYPSQPRGAYGKFLYADESGKTTNCRAEYVSLCGYVGHQSEWHRFGMEWQHFLIRWEIPPIHMSQIMSDQPKDAAWAAVRKRWGTLWEHRRDLMLEELAGVIGRSCVAGVGVVIDSSCFRNLGNNILGKIALSVPASQAVGYLSLAEFSLSAGVATPLHASLALPSRR